PARLETVARSRYPTVSGQEARIDQADEIVGLIDASRTQHQRVEFARRTQDAARPGGVEVATIAGRVRQVEPRVASLGLVEAQSAPRGDAAQCVLAIDAQMGERAAMSDQQGIDLRAARRKPIAAHSKHVENYARKLAAVEQPPRTLAPEQAAEGFVADGDVDRARPPGIELSIRRKVEHGDIGFLEPG